MCLYASQEFINWWMRAPDVGAMNSDTMFTQSTFKVGKIYYLWQVLHLYCQIEWCLLFKDARYACVFCGEDVQPIYLWDILTIMAYTADGQRFEVSQVTIFGCVHIIASES